MQAQQKQQRGLDLPVTARIIAASLPFVSTSSAPVTAMKIMVRKPQGPAMSTKSTMMNQNSSDRPTTWERSSSRLLWTKLRAGEGRRTQRGADSVSREAMAGRAGVCTAAVPKLRLHQSAGALTPGTQSWGPACG